MVVFAIQLPEAGATLRDRHILERELQYYLVQAEQAVNMVVVKTLSGHAQSVCESIDRIGWSEVIGTIAGENTIFVAARSEREAAQILAHLSAVCGD
ncbi:MAG: hypothetical protein ACKVJG_10380 [Candidatus Latescibacterota bacterium]|jgi:transcriptional regulator of arginine metabolism